MFIYTVTRVTGEDIQFGDAILRDGVPTTVCRGDISRGFMGRTIFGDSYRLGTAPVERCDPFHTKPTRTT